MVRLLPRARAGERCRTPGGEVSKLTARGAAPGLTEGAKGSEQMQFIAQLAMMRGQDRRKFDLLFDSLEKLFTPQEPPPDPEMGDQSRPVTGPSMAGLLGQPMGGQSTGY